MLLYYSFKSPVWVFFPPSLLWNLSDRLTFFLTTEYEGKNSQQAFILQKNHYLNIRESGKLFCYPIISCHWHAISGVNFGVVQFMVNRWTWWSFQVTSNSSYSMIPFQENIHIKSEPYCIISCLLIIKPVRQFMYATI